MESVCNPQMICCLFTSKFEYFHKESDHNIKNGPSFIGVFRKNKHNMWFSHFVVAVACFIAIRSGNSVSISIGLGGITKMCRERGI